LRLVINIVAPVKLLASSGLQNDVPVPTKVSWLHYYLSVEGNLVPLIAWRDEFSVGEPAVDREHQEMIQLINDAHAALTRQDDFKVSVVEFLGDIYVKISAHFAREEKIMRERHYDQYVDHKADHKRLLDELRDIRDNIENQTYYNEQIFSQHLNAWFGNHFKTKDARLHQYIDTFDTSHPDNAQDAPRRP
jgi:hemerythrin-like metal-binding protein